MRLIFIRHGDPDYVHDTLTKKGWKEAELLSQRVKNWNEITDIYVSPLGRAKDTASLSLEKLNKEATTLDWLKEFYYPTENPTTHNISVPWDFYPEYWTKEQKFYEYENWFDADIYNNSDVKKDAQMVFKNFDELLAKYGYIREGRLYKTDKKDDDTTLVFFCHLGVSFLIMGYLLGIAPTLMWHSFFVAPTSVSILATEERAEGIAQFRAQTIGDTIHLHDGHEPVSSAGYFTDTFSK